MKVKATDIFTIKTLSQPVSSGQDIFFQENWIDQTANQYQSRIWHLDRTSKQRTLFGHDQAHDHSPKLSPNGAQLAFLSQDADKKTQVFLQAVQGGSARALTKEAQGVSDFFWAADSRSILYTNEEKPQAVADSLPQAATVTKARYKLNGSGLLPENVTYFLKQQKLTNKTGQKLYQNHFGFGLTAVSPDGHTVALTMAVKPDDPQDFSDGAFLFDLVSKKLTLVNQALPQASLDGEAFSMDGSQLLLVGSDNHLPNVAQIHLWHYELASGKLIDAGKNLDLDIDGLVAADMQQGLSGRAAAFLSADYYATLGFKQGAAALYAGGPQEALHLLIKGARQITDWSVSADGLGIVFTASDFTHASRLYYFDLITEEETLLVDMNTRYQHSHDLVLPQHFDFQRDGFTIEGWYYAPKTAAKRHPVVLYVHGGPQAGYGNTFFHEMQFLASQGYGVICMNPRGGVGYGEAFTKAVIQHYGQGDYEDLMAGVDAVLKRDKTADPKHLYVAGGSYGGFMTNWIVTHTTRFAAAVTQRSISDWISFYGTSDIGYYFTPWELTGQWQGDTSDIATLWNFSPLKYVDAVKTPTLVMHSENDLRCPIGQGEEFYTALKLHGVDTKMMRFPQSTHELSRSGLPNLRVKRLEAVADWFASHQ